MPQLALKLTPNVPMSGKVQDAPIGSMRPLLSKAMLAVHPTSVKHVPKVMVLML